MLNLQEEAVLKTAYCNEEHELPTGLFSCPIAQGGFSVAVGELVIVNSKAISSQQLFQHNSK